MKKTILALLLVASSAFGESQKVVAINNESWKAGLLVTNQSATVATVRTTNCIGFSLPGETISIAPSGAALVPSFGSTLCLVGGIGLVNLTTTGTPEITTVALYKDAIGNSNLVEIPTLTSPLSASFTLGVPYVTKLSFKGIQNDNGVSTFLAIFSDKAAALTVAVYDGAGEYVGAEQIYVQPPYTFFRLGTKLTVGRIELVKYAQICGPAPLCDNTATVYAVAFVGGDVGSPRVVTGTPTFVVALP